MAACQTRREDEMRRKKEGRATASFVLFGCGLAVCERERERERDNVQCRGTGAQPNRREGRGFMANSGCLLCGTPLWFHNPQQHSVRGSVMRTMRLFVSAVCTRLPAVPSYEAAPYGTHTYSILILASPEYTQPPLQNKASRQLDCKGHLLPFIIKSFLSITDTTLSDDFGNQRLSIIVLLRPLHNKLLEIFRQFKNVC